MNRFFCGGLMVGLWMMGAASGISSPTPDRPNVLFLITDDAHKHYLNWLPEGELKRHLRNLPGRFAEFKD